MLSILYPKVAWLVRELTMGLMPFTAKADSIPKLIVKISKEGILAAKVRQGFSVHLVPYDVDGVKSVGFLAAFFDDQQHPLIAGGAFIKEFFGRQLARLLLSKEVDVHFFDEAGHELLAYRAELNTTKKHRNLLMEAVFPSLEDMHQGRVMNAMSEWFQLSTPDDDATAVKVIFKYPLMDEDIVIFDLRPEYNSYQGSPGFSYVTLEREEPGAFQEKEIARLLQRTFANEDIYLSPLRTYDNEEITDLLIISENNVLIIQAKDSPNIERIVNNTIERKRKTVNGALKKGLAQVTGAVSYLSRTSPMIMRLDGKDIEVSLEGKTIYSLVILKELFSDDYDEYTPQIMAVANSTGVPCIALSYSELHQYTRHLTTEDAFFKAFMTVFNHGVQSGMFPRLRVHAPGAMGS
ncbi:hypothetical protein ACI2KS_23070 [Pseudomonas sp. NPDC087358]|uniref:hypothetical protein n=1 Tax=Pseudomonas sp. NPDC087358 TaxID=3364439 RepID=UPI00384D7BA8